MSNVTEGIKVETNDVNVVADTPKVNKPKISVEQAVALAAAAITAGAAITVGVFGDTLKAKFKDWLDRRAVTKLEKIRDEKDEKKKEKLITAFKKKYRVDPEAIIAEYGENLYQLRF